jgi:hypothetical protein
MVCCRIVCRKIQGNVPFMRPEESKCFDDITNQAERCTVVVDSTDRLEENLLTF